jgi:hypothetical protein
MTANLQRKNAVREAAKLMNVSERLVYYAGKLRRSGRQDLIEVVERGEMSLHKALKMLNGKEPRYNGLAGLLRAWKRATDEEKTTFLTEITGAASSAQAAQKG